MSRLGRFLWAQKGTYDTALKEIRNGYKETCWMWFIFPQIEGIGYSETAQFFAITDDNEAVEYLAHPVLGTRLKEISEALLELDTNDPGEVMGWPDDIKLQASMTLFYLVSGNPTFKSVLDKFFDGALDGYTFDKLQEERND